MSAHPPDRYAVIGHPVAHSQSPFIHAEFARQTGHPVAYERVLSPLDGFESTLARWAASGARGCNVTVPFKHEALRLATWATERARLAGAANVLSFDDGQWRADNTDGAGLLRDLQQDAACPMEQQHVLLVGAGGAAAGVLGPLLNCRPARVVVANRTLERAQALVEAHAGLAAAQGVALQATGLDRPGQAFDLVLNASASSLSGAAVPVPDAVLRPGTLAVDLMYGSAAAPFLAWAERHGAVPRDGLGMLVQQAAEAFWIWRGVRPDTGPVLRALRERLGAAP